MVERTQVTDAGLLVLAAVPTMTSITTRRSQVTEAGVAAAMALSGRNERLRISN
jgi:hypothetical protein